jgi:hypothetical protein
MAKKATAADAQLILHLYELRRETEMRKARSWWAGSFWPETAEDYAKVASAFSIPENAWLRQVTSYWDMAASFVLRGAVHEDLFFDSCAEMWFTLAKISPILKQIRDKMQSPQLFTRMEKVATQSKAGRDRLKQLEARMEVMRKHQTAKLS